MKKIVILFAAQWVAFAGVAQIYKEQLALAISNADEANTQALKEFIWKRKSDVSINGTLKLTTITEFSFDAQGKLQTKVADAHGTVKRKTGPQEKVQTNADNEEMDYIEKSLELATAYTFMTKGQLLDFFKKAVVTEKGGVIEAMAENIYVQDDRLIIHVDANTNLYLDKEFTSMLGKDPIDGEIRYERSSSGVNHGTKMLLNMHAQRMTIDATNQDYSRRIK